ncbi:uncharacterized protein LY79DRAFT_674527 [Colletotrichum navitas]|uniref:Uncharacterized protein n=1 Tax=Colletotrichum navitas TaxID=681940 RepID=A0AAD8PKU8_9PEZI|nr:uncharacterized protein LY79DRAFT_674527 [Colletotrichum navitas]KAK1569639.1 hypothetical protein LY79DRAFT_674527 [Colletotrichum navitas]
MRVMMTTMVLMTMKAIFAASYTAAVTALDDSLYNIRFNKTSVSLVLHRTMALLERQRLSLHYMVVDALEAPDATFLRDLRKVVDRICLNATYLLSWAGKPPKRPVATASHDLANLDLDMSLACQLLGCRISDVALLWSPLGDTESDWRPNRLRLTAKLLSTAYDASSFLYAYRKALSSGETS